MFSQLINNPLLSQANSDWWTDQFFGLNEDNRFVVLILFIVFGALIIISIAGIIGGTLSSMHRRRMEAEMKSDMLDRGMSAEEIAQVVESAPPQNFLERLAVRQGKKGHR